MANRTDPLAKSVHGTNPQFLVGKIVRSKVYDSQYWKQFCFGLTAATLIDKAIELTHIGGTYGGSRKATPFLCLTLKLLQIQPPQAVVLEYIKNEDFKYLRVLGAFYLRLTGSAYDVYHHLEPLLIDYSKLCYRKADGSVYITHMDEIIDLLLREDVAFEIDLPTLPKRHIVEESYGLSAKVSILEDTLSLKDITPSLLETSTSSNCITSLKNEQTLLSDTVTMSEKCIIKDTNKETGAITTEMQILIKNDHIIKSRSPSFSSLNEKNEDCSHNKKLLPILSTKNPETDLLHTSSVENTNLNKKNIRMNDKESESKRDTNQMYRHNSNTNRYNQSYRSEKSDKHFTSSYNHNSKRNYNNDVYISRNKYRNNSPSTYNRRTSYCNEGYMSEGRKSNESTERYRSMKCRRRSNRSLSPSSRKYSDRHSRQYGEYQSDDDSISSYKNRNKRSLDRYFSSSRSREPKRQNSRYSRNDENRSTDNRTDMIRKRSNHYRDRSNSSDRVKKNSQHKSKNYYDSQDYRVRSSKEQNQHYKARRNDSQPLDNNVPEILEDTNTLDLSCTSTPDSRVEGS